MVLVRDNLQMKGLKLSYLFVHYICLTNIRIIYLLFLNYWALMEEENIRQPSTIHQKVKKPLRLIAKLEFTHMTNFRLLKM